MINNSVMNGGIGDGFHHVIEKDKFLGSISFTDKTIGGDFLSLIHESILAECSLAESEMYTCCDGCFCQDFTVILIWLL